MSFSLSRPANLAFLLLHGMLLLFAVTHFLDVVWQPSITIAFYSVLLLWGLVLAWRHRGRLIPFTILDGLFAGFLLLVLASVVFKGGLQFGAEKYARFLPFMAVVPYLCGRIMRGGDIEHFSRIVMVVGLSILPLLLLDRFISLDKGNPARWTYFGQNHAVLLVGELLAVALVALVVRGAGSQKPDDHSRHALCYYVLIGLVTGFLVWVSARGWLLAAIAGLAVLSLSDCRHRGLHSLYLRYLAYVIGVVALSLALLPHPSSQFYATLLTKPPQLAESPQLTESPQWDALSKNSGATQATDIARVSRPILGEASCDPIKEGFNSVAIRWVLYREAMAMFEQAPILGVGAARFGDQSCLGRGGFPHSTVLQGFAELGLVGGGLLLSLLLLAAMMLMRGFIVGADIAHTTAGPFAFGIFIVILLVDQMYGNYFMSIEMYLMLGIAASMRAQQIMEQNS
jgi:O-Antigen ligase